MVTFGNSSVQIGLQTSIGLAPGTLEFPSIKVGATSKVQAVTLTNVTSASVAISSIALSGANPTDFIEQNNCGAGLHAGASCTISIAFKPTETGHLNASVNITYAGVASPQTATFTGYGF